MKKIIPMLLFFIFVITAVNAVIDNNWWPQLIALSTVVFILIAIVAGYFLHLQFNVIEAQLNLVNSNLDLNRSDLDLINIKLDSIQQDISFLWKCEFRRLENELEESEANGQQVKEEISSPDDLLRGDATEIDIKEEAAGGIPAGQFLKQWRAIRDLAEHASLKSVHDGIDENERAKWSEKYNDLQLIADKMLDILKKNIPIDTLNLLENANKRWDEEVAPLSKNRLWAKMVFEDRCHPNILDELRADGPGQQILRDILSGNPELIRLVLGQKYAGNPAAIHVDKFAQEFITHAPPAMQRIIKEHKEATEKLDAWLSAQSTEK